MPDTANRDWGNQTPSEELVARVAEGDDYAFQILVNRHQTSVLNLIYRFMGDRSKSEDLAQETFLQAWRAAKSFQHKSKFTTWLYRICVNLCLNEIKSARRKKWLQFFQNAPGSRHPEAETQLDESPNPEDLLLARERSQQIANALQTLPENQRIALILKRYDGLSYEEISRVLGCSASAVESLLVRAKRTLQKKLEIFLKKSAGF
ncbi:MAG: sigma-70 family RNA polymerase sigma factor [Deltaproteobacteria bacterium]|nr:sigma-70 family RNA polymerase sigma factor [Deltaproteobacteria bacterium]